MQNISQWAEKNLTSPLLVRPLKKNKIILMIAYIILIIIYGGIIAALTAQLFKEIQKDEPLNTTVLFILLLMMAAALWFIFFIKKRSQLRIVKIDKDGISTAGNRFFEWKDLKMVVFDKAYQKHSINNDQQFTGVSFVFNTAKLYVNYIAPDFSGILMIASMIPVEKKDKMTGEFYY